MSVIYAKQGVQPGEQPIYEIAFTPGKSIAAGDSLTGVPTSACIRVSDGADRASMVWLLQRVGDSIFFGLKDAVDGEQYKVTLRYSTTQGEQGMQVDFIIDGVEY